MSFFKKLFKKMEPVQEKQPNFIGRTYTLEEKLKHKVYPRIKNITSHNLEVVYNEPLGGDLVLTFVQDIDDNFSYVLKTEYKELEHIIDKWKDNLKEVSYDLFTTDNWQGLIYFSEPGDFSNEKIFDPNFLEKACELLETDKIIISITRRHRMQITNYHNTFEELEEFFYSHLSVFKNQQEDEYITESLLVADKNSVTYVAYLGFRMGMYEKNGEYKITYSTTEDIESFNIVDRIEEIKEEFKY